MRVRALDSNFDWTFGSGLNNYKTMSSAIEQSISTRLKTFLGECFFDITAGLDWFNLLGSKDRLGLNLAITASILNTDGVTSINQLSIDLDTSRMITITYSVNTIYTGVNIPNGTVVARTNFLLTEGGDVIVTEGGTPISI